MTTLFIGGPHEFVRECKRAAADNKIQVVGEAAAPPDLYMLVDRVQPDALLLPAIQEWMNDAIDLAKVRPNMLVFVSGPIGAETWHKLAEYRVITVPDNPDRALPGIANAMGRLAPNKFRFEERSITPPEISTSRKVIAVQSKVIALCSTKGGVGKTTISENLAAVLGLWAKKQEVETGSPCRVALIDANMDGSTGVYTWNLFNKPKTALLWDDMDREASELRWQDVSTAMNYSEAANVWYLAPPLLPDEKERFGPKLMQRIIAGCQRFFHFTVIDTGAALFQRDITISAMMAATDIMIVCDFCYKTMRLLADSYKYEIRRMVSDPTRFGLVLNRVEKTWFSTRDMVHAFAKEAGDAIPLRGELPEEPAMKRKEAQTTGVPFACLFPFSPFTRSVLSLCSSVVGVEMDGSQEKRGLFGLGRRLSIGNRP